ncbi:MAG: hypothetical protein WDA16_12665 [Candidatus Thermoplasmatota archaeon]
MRREAHARIIAEVLAVLLVAYIWLTDPKAGGASGFAMLAGGVLTAWALYHARKAAGTSIPHAAWAFLWFGLYVASLFVYPLVGALAVVGAYATTRRPKPIVLRLFSRRARRTTWILLAVITLGALFAVSALGERPILAAISAVAFFASGSALGFSAIAAKSGRPERRRSTSARAALLGAALGIGFALPLLMSNGRAPINLALAATPLAREEVFVLVALPLLLTGLALRTWIQTLWQYPRARRAMLEFTLISLLALLGIASGLDASVDPDATASFASGVPGLRYAGFILGLLVLGVRAIVTRKQAVSCRPPLARRNGAAPASIWSVSSIPNCNEGRPREPAHRSGGRFDDQRGVVPRGAS